MAPKRGKETPLELCTQAIALGNTIAVHILEYLSNAKTLRQGFKELSIDFLEASRALFPAKSGLAEVARARTHLPADRATELHDLLRQYDANFSVLNQMINRLLDNERKQGLSKLGKGFRMMFADAEIEKMRLSLVQCRDASKKNSLVLTWTFGEGAMDKATSIGYTALAAVLDRPDPTLWRTVDELPVMSAARDGSNGRSMSSLVATPSQRYASPRPTRPQQLSPTRSDGALLDHESSIGMARGSGSSRTTTTASHNFSSRSASTGALHDDISEITLPTPTLSVEEMMYAQELDDSMPKQAVRVRADPSSAPRWKPKRSSGAVPAQSKTALLAAVQEGNHKMLEHLLDCGVPANNGPDRSLLRMAISNHDLDSVRLLLLFGADANGKDVDGFTPLHTATESLSFETAALLLKYGADPNLSAGPHEESPFAASLCDDKAHFAQLYLKHGADADGTMDNGDTPFIKAMSPLTSMNLVELMLVYEADPNIKSSHGETALFRAINSKRLDLVNILLDHGADPNLPGPKHMLWPAVHRPPILELLLNRGADLRRAPGVLELATSINSLEAVNLLLKAGADPNAKKDGIFTPLCTAIRDNRETLVDILLAAGADPNVPASEYPAFKCVTHHRAHLLPRILAAGADPNIPKGIVETAVAHRSPDALAFLLEHGVDPNARNAQGHTALTTAIRNAELPLLDVLLAHGADPGVRGHEWPVNMAVKSPDILATLLPHISTARVPKGALELAVQAGQLESVKSLLAKGVDVEERNGGVFSPLTTAIREDQKAIFRHLLDEAGADPNSPGEHLPIIKAIRRHREDDLSYIRHLVTRGADINLMYRGWNAVLQALDKGDTQTLRLLAELGTPDLGARDEDGRTVLEVLRERGMREEERILAGGGNTPSPKMREANSQLREYVTLRA
ncbi:hypothetical protein LTR53_003659 [Teratosphaeriaceae sp. CCFEE 6253]|nr:hypothetical protein LTR53_003659 [Teratosphaeriaceae sp. CCFEE 6253]